MKKLNMMVGAAVLAVAGTATAAHAEGAYTGNVALTTDYKFRGISQTEGSVAIQGGFDYSEGIFYAGTWASNVDLEESSIGTAGLDASTEIDVYAGFKPVVGPVTFDLGVIGYFYPGADEEAIGVGELDYVEGYVKASITVADKLALGGSVFYSPEYTAEKGNAYYLEATAAYPLTDIFTVSGGVGYQSVDDVSGVFVSSTGAAEASDEYATWNLGGSISYEGFTLDLRYVDTDIKDSSLFLADAFTTEGRTDESFIFTIKRAL